MANPMSLSPAGADLGLGGMLNAQMQDETEEMRRRRMRGQGQQPGLGSGMQASTGTQSPATLALFGGMGAIGR